MSGFDSKLAEHSLLNGLSSNHVAVLNRAASSEQVPKGQHIFEQGKEANRFFLIRSGKVTLELYTPQRGPRTIQTLRSGEVFGSSWLVPPFRWRNDARAAEDCELIVFDAKIIKQAMDDDREFGFQLMMRLYVSISQRLDATQKQILELYARSES